MEAKKEILKPLRIDTQLKEQLDEAVEVMNGNEQHHRFSLADLRRLALHDYSYKILTRGVKIEGNGKV